MYFLTVPDWSHSIVLALLLITVFGILLYVYAGCVVGDCDGTGLASAKDCDDWALPAEPPLPTFSPLQLPLHPI